MLSRVLEAHPRHFSSNKHKMPCLNAIHYLCSHRKKSACFSLSGHPNKSAAADLNRFFQKVYQAGEKIKNPSTLPISTITNPCPNALMISSFILTFGRLVFWSAHDLHVNRECVVRQIIWNLAYTLRKVVCKRRSFKTRARLPKSEWAFRYSPFKVRRFNVHRFKEKSEIYII